MHAITTEKNKEIQVIRHNTFIPEGILFRDQAKYVLPGKVVNMILSEYEDYK